MRKIIAFTIILIVLCFLIPIIFTKRVETIQSSTVVKKDTQEDVQEINVDVSYNYDSFTKIKLLHTTNNQTEEVNLDEYLCNVVSAEIPAKYNIEALKAQAIVARTYTIYTIIKNNNKHGEASLCDSSSCCQAWISKDDRLEKWEENVREEYWNKIVQSVNETIGEVITYKGEVINAVYHANSGGKTELASGVWNGGDYPYLQSVETLRRGRI
jgi:stage II sporulation protein D